MGVGGLVSETACRGVYTISGHGASEREGSRVRGGKEGVGGGGGQKKEAAGSYRSRSLEGVPAERELRGGGTERLSVR